MTTKPSEKIVLRELYQSQKRFEEKVDKMVTAMFGDGLNNKKGIIDTINDHHTVIYGNTDAKIKGLVHKADEAETGIKAYKKDRIKVVAGISVLVGLWEAFKDKLFH